MSVLGVGVDIIETEKELLHKLVSLLEFDEAEAGQIMGSVQDGALSLGSRVLEPDESV